MRHTDSSEVAGIAESSVAVLEVPTEDETTLHSASNGSNTLGTSQPVAPTVYHLILFQSETDSIDRDLHQEIRTKLDEVVTTSPENTHIDVWIRSLGGDAHAAYKIILELRSRCKQLQAIIPDYAKSAATLLAIGMDKIYMSASAELGPVDVQLEHPDREGRTISGLDVSDSFDFLAQTALGLALVSGNAVVRRRLRLSRLQTLQELLRFSARFLEPTVAKLDPHIIHYAAQQLKVAEQYAVRMLANRNMVNGKHLSTEEAERLMKRLVKDYPSHGFIISRKEVRSIGLPVDNAENYVHWGIIKRLHDKIDSDQTLTYILPNQTLIDTPDFFETDMEETDENNEN